MSIIDNLYEALELTPLKEGFEIEKIRHKPVPSLFRTCGPGRQQILVTYKGNKFISVVFGEGTYGYEDGLMELWDYDADPIGYLTAIGAHNIIMEKMEKNNGN